MQNAEGSLKIGAMFYYSLLIGKVTLLVVGRIGKKAFYFTATHHPLPILSFSTRTCLNRAFLYLLYLIFFLKITEVGCIYC
ncbi:hypothetical protein C7B76_24860 [filamentous cyanobacterium CCP2]|nr:hypothetical protein C7B76_24860 [filamentous cyanobacterium CCP2]